MISTKSQIVTALTTGTSLQVLYELIAEPTAKPVITYMESYDSHAQTCESFGYDNLRYRIKLWADKVSDIETYTPLIDTAMRTIGGKLTTSAELSMGNQVCKIMDYQFLAIENYNQGE